MPPPTDDFPTLRDFVARQWGFSSLRPVQEQAIRADLDRRDSLVVMPTGGGKSLCYQAPAAFREGEITVVVSPLIALMKDQVDHLREAGVGAVRVDSSLTEDQRREAFRELKAGRARLVFASPEKLVSDTFREYLRSLGVRTFAIDEAHCISQWGHDFRPEYRRLAELRTLFPDAAFHAFTATATPRVRDDIASQLALRDPVILVGNFDRPNLSYRAIPRKQAVNQVLEVLERHKGEAGIVYCLARKEVDRVAATLRELGYDARRYRAANPDEDREANLRERKQTQDAFRSGMCDLVVATVAFGMGIDRPDLRFVVHVGMPQSMEHYQQEAGRAGRDGLPSECVLLYSAGDVVTRKEMVKQSAEEGNAPPEAVQGALAQVEAMFAFCRGGACRHKSLVEHFGQEYTQANCGACDHCLGEVDYEPDSLVLAQKILSAVARLGQRFGVGYVAEHLRGVPSDRAERAGHTTLSTCGLLQDRPDKELRDWIRQLQGAGCLATEGDEYPTLKLTPDGWAVLKGQKPVQLACLGRRSAAKRVRSEENSWEGVDSDLYAALRTWRRELADERDVPPFTIFGDATLREICKVRPTTLPNLRAVTGVGEHKCREYGPAVTQLVQRLSQEKGSPTDIGAPAPVPGVGPVSKPVPATARAAYPLFRAGRHPAEVAATFSVAERTARDYLCHFIQECKPTTIRPWVPADLEERITKAAAEHGTNRMRPVFEALGEKVPYDAIRVVLTFLATRA